MSRFNAIQVSEKLSKAIDAAPRPDDVVLQAKPPEQSDGIEESIELMKSFYVREVEPRLLRSDINNSPTCGMELWYEDEALKFMFYVPDEEHAKHYRRQLSGHFPGVGIENVWRDEDKFISMDEDEHVVAYRMQLKHHYFEPIRSPVSETDDFDHDPYQTLLSEMDTKDDDLRTVVQVLYKPAEDNWTELHSNNVETYSTKLQNGGGVKTRYFGLLIDDVETPKERAEAAKQIRKQVNKPAYYVNVRIAVVAPEKREAEAHANALCNVFENEYREHTKQTLTPKIYRFNHEERTKNLLVKMARREGQFMSQPTNPLPWVRHKLGNCDTMIMTIPELAGLAHIPDGSEINIDGVEWTDAPVSGTLPPEAEKFSPATEKEKKEAIKKQKKQRKGNALERYKSPTGAASDDDGAEEDTTPATDAEDNDDGWGDAMYDPTSDIEAHADANSTGEKKPPSDDGEGSKKRKKRKKQSKSKKGKKSKRKKRKKSGKKPDGKPKKKRKKRKKRRNKKRKKQKKGGEPSSEKKRKKRKKRKRKKKKRRKKRSSDENGDEEDSEEDSNDS